MRRRDSLLAIGGFLLLSLVLTFPLVLRFGAAISGDGFDGWQNYWNLWWMKVALIDRHASPYFVDLLYYPTGVGLLFHTLNPLNGLFTLPLQLSWGLFPAYNLAVLFSFAVGGFGAYLLARQVLGPRSSHWPAFLAGAIFTFAPFHVAHLLGHLQMLSLEWIPFYALYLIRLATRKPVTCHSRSSQSSQTGAPALKGSHALPAPQAAAAALWRPVVRDALLAALFLCLVALCDWYYVLYCLILTFVVLAWTTWRSRFWQPTVRRPAPGPAARSAPVSAPDSLIATRRKPAGDSRTRPALVIPPIAYLLPGVSLAGLVFVVALSPILLPMLREASRFRFMVPDPSQSRALSADLLAFVTPQEFHPLWGDWAKELAQRFTTTVSEHQVFAGFSVLLLAGLGLVAGSRRRTRPTTQGLWLAVLLVFVVLALGPVLHINGQTALLPGGREFALPYGWLAQVIPFLNISRSVSRFDVLVMLALALLAAHGIEWLAERVRGPLSRGVSVLALALVLFEFWPAPYPMSPPDTPAWYATLAADPRPGAVLNLPMNWDRPGYLLYQTVHQKPLVAAYISRDDPRTLVDRAPVLQHFRHLGPDIIDFDLAGQGRQVLADLGIRWVVLDRYKMPGGREREYTEATARSIFGDQAPVYRDSRLTVYEVAMPARTADASPYLVLGFGWDPYDAASHSRSFQNEAPLEVRSQAAQLARLQVTVAQGSAPLDLPGEGPSYTLPLALQAGVNHFVLRAAQRGGRVTVTNLNLQRGKP